MYATLKFFTLVSAVDNFKIRYREFLLNYSQQQRLLPGENLVKSSFLMSFLQWIAILVAHVGGFLKEG